MGWLSGRQRVSRTQLERNFLQPRPPHSTSSCRHSRGPLSRFPGIAPIAAITALTRDCTGRSPAALAVVASRSGPPGRPRAPFPSPWDITGAQEARDRSQTATSAEDLRARGQRRLGAPPRTALRPAAAPRQRSPAPMHGSLARLAQAARRAAAAPRPRKAALELTDAAAERIRALLAKRDKVRSGGQGWCAVEKARSAAAGSACAAVQRRRPRCLHKPPAPPCQPAARAHPAMPPLCCPGPALNTGVPAAGGEDARLQRHGLHVELRRRQGGRAAGAGGLPSAAGGMRQAGSGQADLALLAWQCRRGAVCTAAREGGNGPTPPRWLPPRRPLPAGRAALTSWSRRAA